MQEIERINGLKPYFQQFNVEGENVYIWAIFPESWIIPTTEELNESYGVNNVPNDKENGGGILFYTKMDRGFSPVFDAVEYVVAYNKTLEEKNNLLIEYANKLRDLFVAKPLEELKTLEFVFSSKPTVKETEKKTAPSLVKALPNLKKDEVGKNKRKSKKTVSEEEKPAKENETLASQKSDNSETLAINEPTVSSNSLLDFANEMIKK